MPSTTTNSFVLIRSNGYSASNVAARRDAAASNWPKRRCRNTTTSQSRVKARAEAASGAHHHRKTMGKPKEHSDWTILKKEKWEYHVIYLVNDVATSTNDRKPIGHGVYICIYIYICIYMYTGNHPLLWPNHSGERMMCFSRICISMGWLKGKSTENHRFSHEIWDFPVKIPLNPLSITMIGWGFLSSIFIHDGWPQCLVT